MPIIPGSDPSQGAVPNYNFGAPPAGISFPTQSSGQSGIPVDPSLAALNAIAQNQPPQGQTQGQAQKASPQQNPGVIGTIYNKLAGLLGFAPKDATTQSSNPAGSSGKGKLQFSYADRFDANGQPIGNEWYDPSGYHATDIIPPGVTIGPSSDVQASGAPTSSPTIGVPAVNPTPKIDASSTSGAMGVENPLPLDQSGGMASMQQMMDALAKSQTKNQAYKPSFLQILGNALQTAGRAAAGQTNPTYLEGMLAREQQMRTLRSQQDFNLVKSTLDFRFNQQMQALNAQLQAHVITPAAYESQLGLIQQQYMNLVNQYSRTILATQQNLGSAGMTPTEQGILQQNATSPTGSNVNTAGITPAATPSGTALNTPATGGTGVR